MPRGLRRFYIDQTFAREGACIQLSLRETFHLRQVLRFKPGDVCQIFNRKGQGAEAFVDAISKTEGARLRLKRIFPLKQRSLFLKVAQALPQKKKMDELVKGAEELGVQELWVMETKRNIVRMRLEASERAKHRWERIVVEAAKQSGSPVLMRVEGPVSLEKILKEELQPENPSFLFHPDPRGLSFLEVMEGLRRSETRESPKPVFLFFGPEGGFSEEEVRLAESRGVRKVFLGDSTLRLETAFIGVLGAIRFLFSN